ncbi:MULTISPECIES: glycerate kinase [unclassified Treponema]|uniref:glycerate kinase family protein n=1 Tax=unclassified Treponema TaxID=2638727 RepID=UPI0020A39307|nr:MULTISPECIES: glycerate kinase [unclassified Treponema]UTC66756.1 glycerate kinase [Treponema sp. OMZ 789]UTC69488.1 glycerate kinase [Treponema sp. OMZ 790]UTC72202.1 glycerate kinase [Treponema sp. OMZ 791]
MKKILLIPDSFKGTMSSARICTLMKNSVHEIFPEAHVLSIPVADGGEGSVDAFLEAAGGIKKTVKVKNPFFEEMKSFYGILKNENTNAEKTAVIEMAACAGLPLAVGRLNPSLTTTYGAGELIADALENGCTNIIIGLGGSATNDGGCGAAAALGVKFFDKEGKSFVPTGGTLKNIERIDMSSLNPLVKKARFTTMCDIDNPLFGKNGAAYIFGPQKGADPKMVEELDQGLKHLALIAERTEAFNSYSKAAEIPGAGAAGGMGYGTLIFLGSELKMGIEIVLDTVDFDKKLNEASFVFTGEGKLDSQSLRGKVIVGVAKRAKKKNVPVIAVVGDAENGIEPVYDMGVSAVFSINRLAVPFSQAQKTAETDLISTMKDILRLIKKLK